MATFSASSSDSKQMIISLRGFSHEVCVAATQTAYWEQLTKSSNISITSSGNYVPVELELFCNDEDEPRLQLILQSQYEQDNKQFDIIRTRIHYDLISFENNDRPIYDNESHQVIVFGSLFNSLPNNLFDTERNLLGQRNCNIKRIKNTLACSILIDKSIQQRYRFTIHHEKQTIMDLAAIQIQALVRQVQNQYILAFATKIGRSLAGPIERMETPAPLIDPDSFPSFTPFQPTNKRRRDEDEEQQLTTTSGQPTIDSDQSDDETIPDERRQQRREQVELLLNRICERMQARTPIDNTARMREDSSQIKSYFRNNIALKSGSNDADISIELVEHEIDLRTRGINEHKCTLVFNKQLKMGAGVRDRIKRTAKIRAYEKLKIMTRDTPRENLIIKQTHDGLWKADIQS